MTQVQRQLTQADRIEVFRLATRSVTRHFKEQIEIGMTDDELAAALEQILGIFGGSSGPDRLSVAYTGAGLRIWGGWHVVNHVAEQPLFSGRQTIAMAREVYGISNPDDQQLNLWD